MSDAQGLSYYGAATLARRLRLSDEQIAAARQQLIELDLIAYRSPLYQVLALPGSVAAPIPDAAAPHTSAITGAQPVSLATLVPARRSSAVVDYETYCRIRDHLVRQQLTPAQTARALGLEHAHGGQWAEVEQFRARKAVPRPSKLDAFKSQVVRLLDVHPYSAQQIYQRLAEAGYAGGITLVKDYVHRIRPRRQPAFLKLDFQPGECAQIDWGLCRVRHRPHYAEFPHMPSNRSPRSSPLDLGGRSSAQTRHSFLNYRLFRNVSNASSGLKVAAVEPGGAVLASTRRFSSRSAFR